MAEPLYCGNIRSAFNKAVTLCGNSPLPICLLVRAMTQQHRERKCAAGVRYKHRNVKRESDGLGHRWASAGRVRTLCACVSFHKSFHLSTSPTCIQLTPFLLALLLDKAFRLQDTTDRALLLSDDSSKEQQIKKKNPDLILNGWFCW